MPLDRHRRKTAVARVLCSTERDTAECRFTRNFHMFVTPFGVEGWFLIAQVVCAQAMMQPKQEMKWAFNLFFRCASPARPRPVRVLLVLVSCF